MSVYSLTVPLFISTTRTLKNNKIKNLFLDFDPLSLFFSFSLSLSLSVNKIGKSSQISRLDYTPVFEVRNISFLEFEIFLFSLRASPPAGHSNKFLS